MKTQNSACNRRMIVVCVAAIALLMVAVSLLPLTAFARIGEEPTTPTDIGLAYVSLPNDSQVAVIDTTSHTFVGVIDVATSGCYSPYQVAMSPNEDLVFVACNSSVAVIDTSTNTVIENINLPGVVYDIAFVQDGEYALVTVPSFYTVVVINTTTYAIVDSISILESPERVAAHPYLDRAYVASGYGEVHVIDTNTFSEVESIYLGDSYLSDVVASPDGQLIFVGRDAYPGAVHVIDAVTNSLITTINLPYAVYELSITPDGQTLFGGAGYSGIQVFDVSTLSYETTISVGGEAYNPVVNCAGTELYVGGGYNNYVPVVDIPGYTISNYILLGGYYGPSGIAICPDYAFDGVVLAPPTQSNDGAIGETVVHELMVVNASDTADSYDLVLGGYNWDSALSTLQVGPLQPGDYITFTVSVTVPLSADWYNEDSVTIYATSVTSPSVYSDTAVATTHAYAPPQITVSPDNLASTQLVNTLTTQNLTLNNGNGITGTFEFVTQRTNLAVAGGDSFLMTSILSSDPSLSVYQFTDIGDNYSLVTLQAYDAVIISEYDYGISTSEAAALRQYYESGYPVVLGIDDIDDLNPTIQADLLAIFGLSDVMDGVFYPGTANQSHSIGNGITTLYSVDDGDNDRYVADDAIWIVQGNDSYYYVMAHDGMARTVVFGERLAAWWDVGNTQLIRNAIEWIAAGNLLNSWLTTSPISGTIPTNGSTAVTVTFNSYSLQPGLYTQDLLVGTNQPGQMQISLPVSLTVEPTASMGWVEGTIIDADTGLPLEATIIAQGQPYTITSDANTGHYLLWLDVGSYTLQVSADGYVTETQTVNIVAQQGTAQDFDLVLNVPVASVSPDAITVSHQVGDVTVETLTLSNDGPAVLEYELREREGDFVPLTLPGMMDALSRRAPEAGTQAAVSAPTNLLPTPIVDLSKGLNNGMNQRVLLAPADTASVMQNILQSYPGLQVDYFDARSSTPSLATLLNYDVVITWGSASYADNVVMGDRLADYVDAGGTVIISVFNWSYGGYTSNVSGRFVTGGYSPFETVNQGNHYNYASLGSYQTHPIMTGVTAVTDYYRDYLTLTTGAELIASWDDGEEFVAIKENVISLNTYMGDAYNWVGNIPTLVHNSIVFLSGDADVPWLSTNPVTGTVTGYSSQPVQVTFDASAVQPGTYTANLLVLSNDPVNGRVTIPVTMTVSPADGMGRVMGTVTDLWTGDPLTATVQLVGVYTDTADPDYSIWANAGSHTLIASAEGYMTTTHTITIPANGMVVQDIALEPAQPRLEDMPAELVITAVPGHILPHALTLANTGPLPLSYTWHEVAPSLRQPETPVELSGKIIMYDMAHGQGDLSNYTTLGNAIGSAGGLLTVNFTFPITADTLNNVDVLWVDCCGYTNWTFAESQVVNAWLEAGGAVLVHSQNSPAAADVAGIYNITYQCCQYSYGTTTDISPHPTTVGVSAIYLDYSYDALNYTAAADVTVRDTNGYAQAVAQEQNGGKMVVIDSSLFDNYRITYADNMLFAMNVMNWLADPAYGDVPWLSVSPLSGDIEGHSTQEFTIMVDTTGLALGTHEATLALGHNDPARTSPILLPVTVQVVEQTAAITLTPMSTSGSGLPGTSVTYTLTVQNSGNGPDIFAISVSSDWMATPSMVTTGELAPGQSQQFTVVVQIPADAEPDSVEDTAVTATSQFNNTIAQTVTLTTTTNTSIVHIYLPVMLKP